jgi:nucleotide-binding universal stress UspA family protein
MNAALPDWQPEIDADADLGPLHYRATGSGIAVIAPLGFGTNLDGLDAAYGQRTFLDAIGSGHELITYEQRLAGSDAGSEEAAWRQRGEDLWRVADAAGVERAVLYGVFDAGHTIAHAASLQPHRVLGLIFNLVPPAIGVGDPHLGVTDAAAEEWFGHSGLTAKRRAEEALTAIGIGRSDAVELAESWDETQPPEAKDDGFALLRRASLDGIAQSLQVRALVIEPQRRPAISGWGKTLAGMLPKARLIRPARAGEMLGGIHGFLAIVDMDEGHYASRMAADVSGAAGETEQAVAALRRIVVPVVDTLSSERAAEMACRLGRPQQAEIVLVHVVEVPLSRPLVPEDTPERMRGERALQLGQAIATRHGMSSRALLRFERSAAHGILRVAREEKSDLIVMAFGEKKRVDPTGFSNTMREVLRNAPCEVLIDHAQRVRG